MQTVINIPKWKANLLHMIPHAGVYEAERVRRILLFIRDKMEESCENLTLTLKRRKLMELHILTHKIRLKNGLQVMVLGPEPPGLFVDDGCTRSPDMWWRPACRIHDYEYQLARNIRAQAKVANWNQKNFSHRSDEWWGWRVECRRLKSKAAHARHTADYNLGENMRRVGRGLSMSSTKGRLTRVASWVYVRAVRAMGAWTVRGKGHKGNV